MLENSDELKIMCKASDILLLQIRNVELDLNFVRVVLDKSVIQAEKVQIALIGTDKETASEE